MGLRDLMKVNNSTKPGRIESAQNLMKSSWTIYIENAGKTAKIQRTEEDDKIEDILSYMDSFMTITQKYNFSEKEKYKLKCQVYAYDTRKFGLYRVLNDSIKTQNIYVILRMTKYFLFNKRSF